MTKSTTKSPLWLIIAFALIIGGGVVQGIQSERWGTSKSVIEAAERLQAIPTTFSDWQSEEVEMSERELEIAEAVGNFSRRYKNEATGESVSVMILCGKPGPISVHPPTVCFIGAGWGLVGTPEQTGFSFSDATFWQGKFTRRTQGRQVNMNTIWAWNSDGRWLARENPRIETAGNPFLYKMYISTVDLQLNDGTRSETTQSFCEEFLPIVDQVLFPQELDN